MIKLPLGVCHLDGQGQSTCWTSSWLADAIGAEENLVSSFGINELIPALIVLGAAKLANAHVLNALRSAGAWKLGIAGKIAGLHSVANHLAIFGCDLVASDRSKLEEVAVIAKVVLGSRHGEVAWNSDC